MTKIAVALATLLSVSLSSAQTPTPTPNPVPTPDPAIMVELNKRGVYFDGVTESKKNGNPTGWGFVFKGGPSYHPHNKAPFVTDINATQTEIFDTALTVAAVLWYVNKEDEQKGYDSHPSLALKAMTWPVPMSNVNQNDI